MRGRVVLSAMAFALTLPAAAASLGVSSAERQPPGALTQSVRGALETVAAVVTSNGEETMAFWAARGTVEAGASNPLGANFATLGSGSLMGAVHFTVPWSDYKGNGVAAGTYTLRYWLLPEDGNHMGVALWRDFALLSPAEADGGAAPLDEQALFDLSRHAAGTAHPAVLSLFPVPRGVEPGTLFENDLGQPTAVVDVGGHSVGLVVSGEGEH